MSLDPSGIVPAFIRVKMSLINDRLFDGRIETCQCYQRMVCRGFDSVVLAVLRQTMTSFYCVAKWPLHYVGGNMI